MKKRRTKRRQWWKPEPAPQWLPDPEIPEGFLPPSLTAANFDVPLEHWVEALEAIDKRGDKAPLLALLCSDVPLSPAARSFLADLLQRYQLKRPRGRQSTPYYDTSEVETALALAVEDVRDAIRGGKSAEAALRQVCKERDIPYDILRNRYQGKRGATNRARKRR